MKIISWNVNGLRTVIKSDLKTFLDDLDADIICLQETKLSRSNFTEDIAICEGWESFFSTSHTKSGYSGVATFCKKDAFIPEEAIEGLSERWGDVNDPTKIPHSIGFDEAAKEATGCNGKIFSLLDMEGRCVITKHKLENGCLFVVNVYNPSRSDGSETRHIYKLNFSKLLELRLRNLLKHGSVILLGDMNVCHSLIDTCDESHRDFLGDEARQWFRDLVSPNTDEKKLFFDTFRLKNGNVGQSYTCWSTIGDARKTNYGTRIDYVLCSEDLIGKCTEARILTDVYGSDHCPVSAVFDLQFVRDDSKELPRLCSRKVLKSGKQMTLSGFCVKRSLVKKSSSCEIVEENGSIGKVVKKMKTETRQTSMLSFFGKKNSTPPPSLANEVITIDSDSPKKAENEEKPECLVSPSTPSNKTTELSSSWQHIFQNKPLPVPKCINHNEPCVLRRCNKKGPNFNRNFYSCARPQSVSTDAEGRCNYFKWQSDWKRSSRKE